MQETSAESPAPVRVISEAIGEYLSRLGNVWIEGELSEVTVRPGAQMVFMRLRDTSADMSISIMCHKSVLESVSPLPQNARVVMNSKVSWYAKNGSLSFSVKEIRQVGVGELLAVGITFIWSMVGTNTIIFLTGMATLDQSLNEAARMDGASNVRIFRSITLPQLSRFIQFSFIITIISAFTALFSLIFVMTGGGPGFGTTTLEFFIYQSAFSRGDFGTGAMLGVLLFFMMAILGIGQLLIMRNRDE